MVKNNLNNRAILLQNLKIDLKKSIGHLNYSLQRVQNIDLTQSELSDPELEILESFSSRFARSSDLFISRYLRLIVTDWDPGFRGTMIDLLNLCEKNKLIESANTWLRIRELRNVAAHEYAADDLIALYKEIISLAPEIIKLEEAL